MYLCHQAVICAGHRAVMPYIWASSITPAMHHKWLIHLLTQALRNGDEHTSYTIGLKYIKYVTIQYSLPSTFVVMAETASIATVSAH